MSYRAKIQHSWKKQNAVELSHSRLQIQRKQ